ncbi:MAG: ATP-binding protein [Planctomycetota bacterium]
MTKVASVTRAGAGGESPLSGAEELRLLDALERSEAIRSAIVENLGIGVALISPEMEILDLNRQMREWFPNVNPSDRPICYRAYNNPPRDRVCDYCPTQKTLRDGRRREALTSTPKDDGVRNFSVSSSPVRDQQGRIVAAIEIVEDITERRILEEQLRRSEKMDAIGQLAAGIAHEINTPTQYVGDNTRYLEESFQEILPLLKKAEALVEAITAGAEHAELAGELKAALVEADIGYLYDEIPRAVGESLNGISRVRKIVQSMKEFSHPGGEGMTSTDLNHAIESTITVATNEWKYVAEMKTDLDPDLPAVPCLSGEFNQVILNMIVNAAHAIADVVRNGANGKGTITISTRRAGDDVEIQIADTGTGIPEKARAKVFDPFFTTKEVGKGTGQGLSIAHNVIVKKHKGTLDFETEVGKGTTFIIRLPLVIDA